MSRKRKKSSPLGLVVLVLLLVLVAGLVVLRVISDKPDILGDKATSVTPVPGEENSSVDITATAAPALPAESTESPVTPAPTPSPTPSPTPVPTNTPQPPVILDNQGELEIFIPDDLISDGF